MSDFKKFIDTNGKTLAEIKKSINEIVNQKTINNAVNKIVDDVVDDITELMTADTRRIVKNAVRSLRSDKAQNERHTKTLQNPEYSAQKIPDRDTLPKRESDAVTKYSPNKNNLSYNIPQSKREPTIEAYNSIAYPHEAIPEDMNAQDELMLNKIREMRTLEELTRNSYVVRACAEITMIRQGEFMAEVEDDFGRRVFCGIPQPLYAAMSNSQLRTYFSWRTDVRRGVCEDIDEPYAVLYCYELLNKIGVSDSEEAYRLLLGLWESFHFTPKRSKLVKQWIKDFYAFNNISANVPFQEVIGTDFAAVMEIGKGNYADKLDFLAANSAYDLSTSSFINEKTRPIMNGAVEKVLEALAEHFRKYGVELSSLICGKYKKDFSWQPFDRAIVDIDRQDGFREVQISPVERYTLKRGEPVLERFELSVCRGMVGYILKSVEAKLRRLMVYGKYLSPSFKMLENDIKNRDKVEQAVKSPGFSDIIPNVVEEYCRKAGISIVKKNASKKSAPKPWDEKPPTEPVVVKIDISKLDEIRRLADENARKLIVDEPLEAEFFDNAVTPNEHQDYQDIADNISDDEFSEAVAEYSELAPTEEESPMPEFAVRNPCFEQLDPEWKAFAENLTPDNILFLRNMLGGTEREFCRSRDIMPQTMIEEINAEAILAIDDVIIEGGVILEDYTEQANMLVTAFKL